MAVKAPYGNLACLPLLVFTTLLIFPDPAAATQAHGQPEGIYTHQLAHIFFLISMAVLVYWLKARDLVIEPGWRYIQVSAFFLMLWNLDAMAVHFLEEQLGAVTSVSLDGWQVYIAGPADSPFLPWLFYLFKLDHLLCVPALLFLYLGLRRLIITVDDSLNPKGRVR